MTGVAWVLWVTIVWTQPLGAPAFVRPMDAYESAAECKASIPGYLKAGEETAMAQGERLPAVIVKCLPAGVHPDGRRP